MTQVVRASIIISNYNQTSRIQIVTIYLDVFGAVENLKLVVNLTLILIKSHEITLLQNWFNEKKRIQIVGIYAYFNLYVFNENNILIYKQAYRVDNPGKVGCVDLTDLIVIKGDSIHQVPNDNPASVKGLSVTLLLLPEHLFSYCQPNMSLEECIFEHHIVDKVLNITVIDDFSPPVHALLLIWMQYLPAAYTELRTKCNEHGSGKFVYGTSVSSVH